MLTFEQFITQATKFCAWSTQIGDDWRLIQQLDTCRQTINFLSKQSHVQISMNNSLDIDTDLELEITDGIYNQGLSGFQEVDEIKDSNLVVNSSASQNNDSVCSVLYHVIYSESYSVPVLYINAQYQDGRMLVHNEIEKLGSPLHRNAIVSQLWSTLTQTEHPIYQTPFYMLHPCKTASMMAEVLPRTSDKNLCNKQYLIQWLSSVGPAIGLDLPLSYADQYDNTTLLA